MTTFVEVYTLRVEDSKNGTLRYNFILTWLYAAVFKTETVVSN